MPQPFSHYLQNAVSQYPTSWAFTRWRSEESKTAADYLRQLLAAPMKDEAKMLAVVSFLVSGTPAPPGQPANVLRLNAQGRLAGLLNAAWDSFKRQLPVSARQADKQLNYFDGRTKTLAGDLGAQKIELSIRQKYDAAIAAWKGHQPPAGTAWDKAMKTDKVSAIEMLNPAQHLSMIDLIWGEIIQTFPATTAVNAMVDPAAQAYNSSHSNPGHAAFRLGGYCFRCDSRDPASVTTYGFLPLYAHNPPPEVTGTFPHRIVQAGGVGMFKDNRDAVGEMVVCVARQMRGATKFPSPGYAGVAYVYALKLGLGDQGFDTENWQISLPDVSLWKPGEKAMRAVAAAQVLGHVQVTKSLAAGGNEYFRFKFDANAWTYTANAAPPDRLYLDAELAAIYNAGAVQAINVDEDFLLG